MIKILKKLTIIFCIVTVFLFCKPYETKAEKLFPELNSSDLISAIAQEYTPESTLGYRRGREVLYTKIDNQNGEVEGIYTGMIANIDSNSDTPRDEARAENINAEHIYPQSKGATGTAKSDLHSLFPSKTEVNNSRGNSPFKDIDDSLTKKWFRNKEELAMKPTDAIDEYSESIPNQLFEPRENKKGDVARAMFYFYTIYKSKADQKDPNFFPSQVATLCLWNQQDLVESKEIARSNKIAEFQGNENPFIIDSTLAERTYCQ